MNQRNAGYAAEIKRDILVLLMLGSYLEWDKE